MSNHIKAYYGANSICILHILIPWLFTS